MTQYTKCCDNDFCVDFELHCDSCLGVHTIGYHCYGRAGANGCHETFATRFLFLEHIHKLTRGCKFPGNIPYFFERDNVWYKNHLQELRDRMKREGTLDPLVNSKHTPSVENYLT